MNSGKFYIAPSLCLLFSIFIICMGCGDFEDSDFRDNNEINLENMTIGAIDKETINLSFNPSIPELNEIEIDGLTFTKIDFGSQGFFGKEGAPGLPYFGINFVIPSKAEVGVRVEYSGWVDLGAYRLMPVQPPAQDTAGIDDPIFAYLPNEYKVDKFLPLEKEILEDEKISRGVRVNQLWVCPIEYNSATGRLLLAKNIKVTINFFGDTGKLWIDPHLKNPTYERMLQNFTINFSVFAQENADDDSHNKSGATDPVFYIITHPDFLEAAKNLANWKMRMGIVTEVVTTEESGKSAKEIKEFISAAYHNNSPPLEYVLLIGDSEFLPTIYGSFHLSYFSKMGSDHYYACVDGDDSFGDIGVGRISVDTPNQANDRVDKIIKYQQGAVDDESFYNTSYHFAYFQDRNEDKIADRRFLLTSEEMYRWFQEVYNNSPITPNRCYVTPEDVTPQKWSRSSSYNFFADWWTWDRTNLPSELLRSNGFDWSCHNQDIAGAINTGVNFVTHRDHGWALGWGDPQFYFVDVMSLDNGIKTPVVFSINCETGWFDNETDSIINFTPDHQESFAEAWQRNLNGGAVGVIASARISYSGYNDRLVWGWMDALWPGYIPRFENNVKEVPDSSPPFGHVLNYGKYYLFTQYGPIPTRKIAMEEFQWFGDPTMKMWTQAPLEFDVDHQETISFLQDYLDVHVPVKGGIIILTINGKVVGNSKTSGEEVSVPISIPIEEGMVIDVTITKDNYRPYMGRVRVAQCGIDNDCSDGVFCNGLEVCSLGQCGAGEAPECDDDLFCTGVETCDEESEGCRSSGNPCSTGQSCDETADSCKTTDDDESDSADTCGF